MNFYAILFFVCFDVRKGKDFVHNMETNEFYVRELYFRLV